MTSSAQLILQREMRRIARAHVACLKPRTTSGVLPRYHVAWAGRAPFAILPWRPPDPSSYWLGVCFPPSQPLFLSTRCFISAATASQGCYLAPRIVIVVY